MLLVRRTDAVVGRHKLCRHKTEVVADRQMMHPIRQLPFSAALPEFTDMGRC